MEYIELNERLFQTFIERGAISATRLQEAKNTSKKTGEDLLNYLVEQKIIAEKDINRAMEQVSGVPCMDPSLVSVDPDFITHISEIIPRDLAEKHKIFPIKHEENYIHIVMSNPTDTKLIKDLNAITGSRLKIYGCHKVGIQRALDKFYPSIAERTQEIVLEDIKGKEKGDGFFLEPINNLIEKATNLVNVYKDELERSPLFIRNLINYGPIVRLIQEMFDQIVKAGTSDIHFEPFENQLRIRIRKDGVLHTKWVMAENLRYPVAQRIKLMSQLDLNKTGVPQDGRIEYGVFYGKDIDIRVSILPSNFGEKVVLRLLDKSKIKMDLDDLGFDKDALEKFKKGIDRPNGMVLVTGPTGSGKTSTLYGALNRLNSEEVNILTAEDPIEYQLFGITQVQMNPAEGLTFASALRSFLRQDPDIIMVGEIRDAETADIAVKAALTGHLVLSTLHTNDSASTVTRLINMGIEPFLIASSLILVEAQRLIRLICPNCKEPAEVSPATLRHMALNPDEFKGVAIYKGKGCNKCDGTGYKGRSALVEILEIPEPIRELIMNQASAAALQRKASELGMKSLREIGIEKVKRGMTTLEEIQRVTVAEET